MRFLAALVILALAPTLSTALTSYYPEDFSIEVDNGLKDGALKASLFEILSKAHIQSSDGERDTLAANCGSKSDCIQHTSLGYTPARKIMFGQIHLVKTNRGYAVRDVYCQTLYDESMFNTDPPGPNKIPNGKLVNTEHSWPQSHFSKNFPKDLQKSDLHILFPANTRANTSRSNLELGKVSQTLSSPCTDACRGFTSSGGRQSFFEPPDAQKGASARAILYFSVRYKLPISQVEEEALKKWHHEHPVSAFERKRNDLIFQAQHNRNPFVDDPDLVDRISDF